MLSPIRMESNGGNGKDKQRDTSDERKADRIVFDGNRIIVHGVDKTHEIEERAKKQLDLSTAFVPHARARIREAKILEMWIEPDAEGRHHTLKDIGEAVGMTISAVAMCLYRLSNRVGVEQNFKTYVARQLDRLAIAREVALEMMIAQPGEKRTMYEKATGIDKLIKIDEREAKILGIDAPKSLHVTGNINHRLFKSGGEINPEVLQDIQAMNPIEMPDDIVDAELVADDAPVDDSNPETQAEAHASLDKQAELEQKFIEELAARTRESNGETETKREIDFKIL